MKLYHWIGLCIWAVAMTGMMIALFVDHLNGIVVQGFLMMAGVQLFLHRPPTKPLKAVYHMNLGAVDARERSES